MGETEEGGGVSEFRERVFAMREGYCADAEDKYFAARRDLDTKLARRVFRAAFERGYDRAQIVEPFGFDDATIDRIAEKMPEVAGFLKRWGYRQFARAIEEAHGIYPDF